MAIEKRKFKTKKVLSGVRSEFRAWDDWAEGDAVVGKLIGTSQSKFNPAKKNWIIEIVEAHLEEKAAMKKLKPGTNLTLNSAGQLDKGMEQVEIGALVQVTYNGKHEMQGGKYAGKESHTMEVVEIEEDNDDQDEEEEELDEEESDEDDL